MKIATKFPKLFIGQKTNGTTLDVLNLRKFSLTKLWPINVDFCKRKWTSLDENTTTLEYVHLLLPQPFYILKIFRRVGRPGQNVKMRDKKEVDKRALETKR